MLNRMTMVDQSTVRAHAALDLEADPMIQLPALGAALGGPELEGEYPDGVIAGLALIALLLALLALVEVRPQRIDGLAQGNFLLTIVNIVQVLQAEEVYLQAVVQLVLQQPLDELGIADAVVHKVDFPFEDQEVEQFLVGLDDLRFIVDFYYRLLLKGLQLEVGRLADVVTT